MGGTRVVGVVAALGLGWAAWSGLVTGAVSLDLGVGRRVRPLGPQRHVIAAPRAEVFDLLAAPYGSRTTRAMREKVRVIERGADMVLAAHYTPVSGGLTTTTVETVRFAAPERIDFALVRGPVPMVRESFRLVERGGHTVLDYDGEMGTDLWWLGERWGDVVARNWEQTVADSLTAVAAEAERRAAL